MKTVARSACGASAFTQFDPSFSYAREEAGAVFSKVEGAPAHSWDQLIDELLRIRTLQDDWDGEGTEAPHPSLVDRAITLAQDLRATENPPADRVIASVNGTIYFEWHTPLGYQEIEVTSPIDAEGRWVEKGSDETVVFRVPRRP